MKKKRAKYVLVLSLIYILLIIFSTLLAYGITWRNNTYYQNIVDLDLKHYVGSNGRFPAGAITNGGNYFVYNQQGDRVSTINAPGENSRFDFDSYVEKLLDTETIEESYSLWFQPSFESWFAVVIQVPMEDGGLFLFWIDISSLRSSL